VIDSVRILIVEDDFDTAESMCILLSLHGYDACICSNGQEAIREASASPFDIVLLDLGLRGPMDGMRVARKLRELSQDRQPLLIAISGYTSADARQQSHEAGIDFHFAKPVDIRELLTVFECFLCDRASSRNAA
jgi:DNA-binding response OmpR family regulator